MILYGAANVVIASVVLLGMMTPATGYDGTSMLGHALLWDPLFLLWGLALFGHLVLTRDRPSPSLTGSPDQRA